MNRDENKKRSQDPPYDICERTFQFALRVVQMCSRLQSRSVVSQVLLKQLLRSGTSVGANIEEGQAAQSRADFVSKYSIARKEAREANYWLRLLAASGIHNDSEVSELTSESTQLVKILTTIIKNARNQ